MARTSLTGDDARRLAGVLSRLASNHDGEVLAAAAAAVRLLRARGIEWSDVLGGTPSAGPRRAPPPTGFAAKLAMLRRHAHMLNDWERGFLAKLSPYRVPSLKQMRVVNELVAKVEAATVP